MQLMYRQLVEGMGADDTGSQREIRGGSGSGGDEAEEVGPGLDLFSHRRLYFGDLAGNQNLAVSSLADSSPLVFLHPSTASRYLERYLSTTYYLMPFVSKDTYRRRLEQLYDDPRSMSLETPDVTIMLLLLANGAAMLEEEQRAESLFKKARANAATFDELVNIQAIQVPLIMISFTLHQFCARASSTDFGAGLSTPIIKRRGQDPILHSCALELQSEKPSLRAYTKTRDSKWNGQMTTLNRRGLRFGVCTSMNGQDMFNVMKSDH